MQRGKLKRNEFGVRSSEFGVRSSEFGEKRIFQNVGWVRRL
ncbi:tRNA (Guanine37-N1)-methyltransferase [Crocosphaera watsonii WH 0401]|uniref:tRNA (Guanine37-N1)-methyltransferase n=1 Tax=Crocosphaera watsonii WH 0401 TaxID=555881 RepID=T2J592_CROWT|nr:tRNA (Guanine37-N1)-methyltransferase [Crocosphaera watsonii WH 0401]